MGIVASMSKAFEKNSKRGIKTPKKDMDLIHARLKAAKQRCALAASRR